jgi:hypothetical protein
MLVGVAAGAQAAARVTKKTINREIDLVFILFSPFRNNCLFFLT